MDMLLILNEITHLSSTVGDDIESIKGCLLFLVSFQQSSIHAVRSFSASFPARRGSVATTLMLGNNATAQKDKTGIDPTDDNDRGPKRRLLRTKSVPLAIR